MKVIAVNGSPRKNFNTSKMLQSALEGVKSAHPEAEAKLVNLYDLSFSGCRSCFMCKLDNPDFYGRKCFCQDPLSPLLEEIAGCDGLILGSPVYLGQVSGYMHCFLERLIYPFYTYEADGRTTAPKRMPTAFIYTMNYSEEGAKAVYADCFKPMENWIGRVFSQPEVLCAYNTYQFSDYSKYLAPKFDEAAKASYRDSVFPKDLEAAFSLGSRLIKP